MERIVRKYYDNGNLRQEYTIINFNKEGVYKEYYQDGTLYIESNYYRNKLEGVKTEYYRSGNKYCETHYVAGKTVIFKRWNDSSKDIQVEETNYKNGLYKTWRDDGSKFDEYAYRDGNTHGVYKIWWDNNNKCMRGNYVDNLEEGLREYWNYDGSYDKVIYIKDGRQCPLQYYVKEQTAKYKEEMVVKFFHPDRLERMAKLYNMDVMDYMDCLE